MEEINVSVARPQLADLIKQVAETGEPLVIVVMNKGTSDFVAKAMLTPVRKRALKSA